MSFVCGSGMFRRSGFWVSGLGFDFLYDLGCLNDHGAYRYHDPERLKG